MEPFLPDPPPSPPWCCVPAGGQQLWWDTATKCKSRGWLWERAERGERQGRVFDGGFLQWSHGDISSSSHWLCKHHSWSKRGIQGLMHRALSLKCQCLCSAQACQSCATRCSGMLVKSHPSSPRTHWALSLGLQTELPSTHPQGTPQGSAWSSLWPAGMAMRWATHSLQPWRKSITMPNMGPGGFGEPYHMPLIAT